MRLVAALVALAALTTSLPALACGMPPRDEMMLADAMAEIDVALAVGPWRAAHAP